MLIWRQICVYSLLYKTVDQTDCVGIIGAFNVLHHSSVFAILRLSHNEVTLFTLNDLLMPPACVSDCS